MAPLTQANDPHFGSLQETTVGQIEEEEPSNNLGALATLTTLQSPPDDPPTQKPTSMAHLSVEELLHHLFLHLGGFPHPRARQLRRKLPPTRASQRCLSMP